LAFIFRREEMRHIVAPLLIMAFGLGSCKEQANKAAPGKQPGTAKEKVEVVLHVMSQCPFGVQAENIMKEAIEKIGRDRVDLKLEFIGNEPQPGQLSSMHGENELKGDLLQVCAQKYAPEKLLDLLDCMNKNYREIPNNFDGCAQQVGIDGAKIKACADGDEGKQLLSASFKRSQEKGARGSPTIFIAGQKYEGARQADQFARVICNGYKTEKPEYCKNIPEPKKIGLTVLSDKRCKDCMPDRILGQLKNMMPGIQAKVLDYNDPEGRQLYDSLKDKGVKLLPAFLFEPVVMEDPGSQQIQRFMVDAGPYKLLNIGAKFDPTAEICDNNIDDDNNGKVDCDDPGCQGQLVCRPTIEKDLKVFVMSQCPFGIKALNSMKEVLEAFKDDKINFEIHYIADEQAPGQFSALHGQGEVDENIRQLCAMKYYPKDYKYMDYIWCRNENIRDTNWQECAKKAGMDVAKIEKCATGDEGKKLLSEDLKIAKALNIGASPTWLANNKFKFSGLAAEQIKQNLCSYNKDLKGCSKTLSSDVQGPQGGCGN
jgi:predicted DsbA family dithiol-disulfide isomerase